MNLTQIYVEYQICDVALRITEYGNLGALPAPLKGKKCARDLLSDMTTGIFVLICGADNQGNLT